MRSRDEDKAEIKFIWKCTIVALVLLICIVYGINKARAEVRTEIAAVSWCQWKKPPNMLWRQDGFKEQLELESPCLRLGVELPVTSWFNVGASVHHLGKYFIGAAVTSNESCYGAHGPSHCGPPDAYTSSSGSAYGGALTASVHYKYFFLTAGLQHSEFEWRMQIYKMHGGLIAENNERFGANGYVIGGGIEVATWRLSGHIYNANDPTKDVYPSGMGQVTMVSLSKMF